MGNWRMAYRKIVVYTKFRLKEHWAFTMIDAGYCIDREMVGG